jgi:hypothetical protein
MHYPQLPDPNGWDVRVTNSRRAANEPLQWIVADDWLCTESGPVSGIHFWVSWMQETQDQIANIHLSIHADIPQGPDGWSIPGEELWFRDLGPQEYSIRHYGTGEQGWYDPQDSWMLDDHTNYYQVNVTNIENPFVQEEGTIYWLDVSVDLIGEGELGQLGWKTSSDHWNDDAVYWDPREGGSWQELIDPRFPNDPVSLDMAFVIVPEPQAWVLFGFGFIGVVLVARRKVLRSV